MARVPDEPKTYLIQLNLMFHSMNADDFPVQPISEKLDPSAKSQEDQKKKFGCRPMECIRSLVSKNKKRVNDGSGGSLDLGYITNRIIAMGFPASGAESLYRNDRGHVVSFLTKHHGQMIRIYNLCAEKGYEYSPKDVSPCSVARFPFRDHNVCGSMQTILGFCIDAALFLQRMDQYYSSLPFDKKQETKGGPVIAVHCKAGKGRTGMMICALLVFLGL